MIIATIKDRALVIDILTKSFIANKSVNYIIKTESNTKQVRALMAYSFDVCMQFGNVFLSENRKGCALLLASGSNRTSLYAIWLDIKLIIQAIGPARVGIALKRESAIKKVRLKEEHLYLWFVGVHPDSQHRNIGSELLSGIIDLASARNLPLCLETSTVTNLPWYAKYGFEIYNQLDLGYLLYFLKTKH